MWAPFNHCISKQAPEGHCHHPEVEQMPQALAHCSRHCLRSFAALASDKPGKSPVLSTRTSDMGTGCLTLARSLTLTLPRQGEVGGPKVRAESAGIPGGRGRWQHWCGGLLGNASSGGGAQSSQSDCPPHLGPLPAHTDCLKGPQRAFARRSAGPRVFLPAYRASKA